MLRKVGRCKGSKVFIALRDLAYAKGRFALMGLVVALVAYLMTFLSGLSGGLISNNVSGLIAAPANHFAFQYDDRPTFRSSLVDRAMWEGWQARPGVRLPLMIARIRLALARGDASSDGANRKIGHMRASGDCVRQRPQPLQSAGLTTGM